LISHESAQNVTKRSLSVWDLL